MKGLRIIPMFAFLLVLTYLGVMFVQDNPADVAVRFGKSSTPSTALGFVILSSVLVGMILAGALCSIQLMVLYMQNQKLRRKVFPHATAGTGMISSMLGNRLNEDLREDVDERLRDSSEPRNDTTGSGLT